ncbi:MAG: hypothetical protein DHS20C17_24300 [Cyclobacteriaceae bacterium]|nr:MAG: hypothetical protein DHS20C17_24300 [Cyclobacteriaceae bacterium]
MKILVPVFFYLLFLCIIGCSNQEKSISATDAVQSTIFQLLDPETTGVNFRNTVVDGEFFNGISYRNFYNGGGVAIGDINNDSLPDLYFTSNQGSNKLYLNQGGMSFTDITESSGVKGTKTWSTGVTMTDINGDGLLDIYVCNSGDLEGGEKENELFINNGDLTFTEKAADYNLGNSGYSTHAAFFDYDLDGDLDCYILNNSFRDPSKIELYRKVREEANDPGGDKLMRNDNGVFIDVTKDAGIYSSDIGFGLGVSISDLNGDQLPDIYISNDFWERDYLYLNQPNGTFSEELITRINYCSISSMGSDIADINNDGTPEIFTTDMLPADNYRLKTSTAFDPYHLEDLKYRANFHYQMAQNCLHLNDGSADFQEVAMLAGVAATDWSWGALIFDFENDGFKDIFVSNGIARDLMSMDFRDFIADGENKKKIVDERGKFDQRDFVELMPSNPLVNYAFQDFGTLIFKDRADLLGLGQPSFSNGSVYGDLDNDGDLDLVVNNINQDCFIYRNESNVHTQNHYLKIVFDGYASNPFGIGARVTLKSGSNTLVLENYNNRGFQSSTEPTLLFGLGEINNIDELQVVWPDRQTEILQNVTADQTIILRYKDATTTLDANPKSPKPLYQQTSLPSTAKHTENRYNDFDREILLSQMLSTEGPRLISGDVNNDQKEDFVLLGASGDPDKLFLQTASGNFTLKSSSALSRDSEFESTCGALFDQDGDGDMDLMIGSGGNEIEKDRKFFQLRLYKNDGKGNFTSDQQSLPQVIGNFSTLEPQDYDQDGAVDVFLGARSVPGNYGLPPRSYLLRNVNGTFIDKAPESIGNIGMVTDAVWTDLNGDSDPDLVIVGDWMAVNVFLNDNGKLQHSTVIPSSSGWWTRVEQADLDDDGDMDLVLGNWGLNTKFKASPEKPLTMFVNDFDQNGKSEFILNWYPPGDQTAYPFASKMDLTGQLPGLRKSILKYEDYAYKTYDSLFHQEIRDRSIAYSSERLESSVLWNNGDGSYKLSALPIEAQVSPVYGIVVEDLDDDGHQDIWMGGNFYALKPQVGRCDASRGVFLKGSGNGSFEYLEPKSAGIFVPGEVRDAKVFDTQSGKKLLVARNNDTILQFKRN